MAPAATLRVLVHNLVSDTPRLQFSEFVIDKIADLTQWKDAKEFFPEVVRGEWILTREYAVIPPASEGYGGFGSIPNDVEDMLLLLRLYRTGDLSFAAVHLSKSNESGRQHPYRVISNLLSNYSIRPYEMNQAETLEWEQFEAPLRTSLQWKATWFRACRKWFLYGGSNESMQTSTLSLTASPTIHPPSKPPLYLSMISFFVASTSEPHDCSAYRATRSNRP